MKNKEILIKDLSKLPRHIFHMVPQKFFYKHVDKDGNYDCRNKEDWGGKSSFIHTTPTKRQLKERVADMNWIKYPLDEKFLLLKIDSKKLNCKITYSIISDNIYHHIWALLPRNSFKIFKVYRKKDGKFLFK